MLPDDGADLPVLHDYIAGCQQCVDLWRYCVEGAIVLWHMHMHLQCRGETQAVLFVFLEDWEICIFPGNGERYVLGPQHNWEEMTELYGTTIQWSQELARASGYPLDFENILVSELGSGDPYAYATLLLSILHNLRSLRLDFKFLVFGGLPGLMLQHSLSGKTSNVVSKFGQLERVDYGSSVPYMQMAMTRVHYHQLQPWFHLPSLKTLEIWLPQITGLSWVPGPEGATMSDPGFRALETLFICRSSAKPYKIAALINGLPMLKSLHIGMLHECVAANDFLLSTQPLVEHPSQREET